MMEMYFVTKVKFSDLLFKGLDINTTAELVGACVVTFLVAVVCEALNLLKLYLALRMNEDPLAQVQSPDNERVSNPINSHSQDEVTLLSSLRFPVTVSQIQARKMMFHFLGTLSHTFLLLWGYILMLLVMSYSVWLTIAVIVGCGAGYFIFGAFKQKLQNMYSPQRIPRAPSAPDENHESSHVSETVHM